MKHFINLFNVCGAKWPSRFVVVAALAVAAALTASAQMREPVPVDPDLRTGTLSNGLTYYVRHNDYPEHRADFFIAQRVGSIQEMESQRGLAHFLEHMCFNGTRHFPGNAIIDYMESIGVKFGANLNAYTSTDETVYNICNVPTTRQGALDTCLLVLSDWSQDLLLKGKDIDEERGVIEGEYRHRAGANYRFLDKALPRLYPGSLYGQRQPIGLMSVVKTFKHKVLRDYYKRWYHPSNQCIIVVGDIDADRTVAQIEKLFGKVKNPKNAPAVTPVAVPDNEQAITIVETDPEQTTTSVRLMFKHDGLDDALNPTVEFLRHDYVRTIVVAMLRERMADVVKQPGSPVTHVGITDRNYMLSKTKQALQIFATARDASVSDSAMTWIAREVRRAVEHGFTEGELRRAQLDYEAALDKFYRERDKYTNTRYARDFVRAYLDGEPVPSIEQNYRLMQRIISQVTLTDADNYLRSIVSDTDRNVVLVTFAPEAQRAALPTEAALLDAFHQGRDASTEAYVDTLKASQLLPSLPHAGKVVDEQRVPEFDATCWTLSNGIHVYVKPTTITAGEVVLAGTSRGGFSQGYDPQHVASYKALDGVIAASGFGQFSSSDLKKVLAGKDVKMRTFVNKVSEGFQGSSSRTDLETAMQLLHLKLTRPVKDEGSFTAYLESNRSRIAGQGNDPKYEFADSIFSNVFNGHPLGAERLTLPQIDQVDYDFVLDVYRDRMSDLSDLNVIIVGDFDTDSLKNLVETYIASLPGGGRVEQPADIAYRLFPASKRNYWTRHMENPQDKVYYFWTNDCPYNLRNTLLAKISGQLVTNILREELREKRGWTYHVDTHCSVVTDQNGDDGPVIFMPLNVTVQAGTAAATRDIIEATIASVARDGVTAEALDKVKKYLIKVHNEDITDNTYWMAMINNFVKHDMDFNATYVDTINAITPADITDFVARYIVSGRVLTLTMTPE